MDLLYGASLDAGGWSGAATTRAGAVLQRPLSLAGLDLEARLRLQGEVAFRAKSLGSTPREEPQPRGEQLSRRCGRYLDHRGEMRSNQ